MVGFYVVAATGKDGGSRQYAADRDGRADEGAAIQVEPVLGIRG
jgi:hypothetical protein